MLPSAREIFATGDEALKEAITIREVRPLNTEYFI